LGYVLPGLDGDCQRLDFFETALWHLSQLCDCLLQTIRLIHDGPGGACPTMRTSVRGSCCGETLPFSLPGRDCPRALADVEAG
jgi:hypothetical protein